MFTNCFIHILILPSKQPYEVGSTPTSFSEPGMKSGFELSSAHLPPRLGLQTHYNRHTLFHAVLWCHWLILLVDCFLRGLHQVRNKNHLKINKYPDTELCPKAIFVHIIKCIIKILEK